MNREVTREEGVKKAKGTSARAGWHVRVARESERIRMREQRQREGDIGRERPAC